MARIIFKENVLEKAQERIRYAFDDFETVICTISGGKDSLVCLHLAIMEAEKRGRKVRCVFLDQEAEWEASIVEVRRWMQHPTVEPYWIRAPFILENSMGVINDNQHYLLTYDPENEDKWIHPRDPLAIYEWPVEVEDAVKKHKSGNHDVIMYNGKNYQDFYFALGAALWMACEGPTMILGGMRANEALGRLMMSTHKIYRNINSTYWATHGCMPFLSNMQMNPIYDWKGSDVWKYIYDNKLPYNSLYDRLYQIGTSHRGMRVSSVCHEMALSSISVFAEIEPAVWDRIQRRLAGANSMHNLGNFHSGCPDKFPALFRSWQEYRDYLFEVLVPENKKPALAKVLARLNRYMGTNDENRAIRCQIDSILICDLAAVYVTRFIGAATGRANKKREKAELVLSLAEARQTRTAVVKGKEEHHG